ncbi:MAG: hypothetical protein ACW98A_17295 [Candidatus Hodarchaeales archaeon]
MKKSPEVKLILMLLVINFALWPLNCNNLDFHAGSGDRSSEHYNDVDLYSINLKASEVSERIHIDNN